MCGVINIWAMFAFLHGYSRNRVAFYIHDARKVLRNYRSFGWRFFDRFWKAIIYYSRLVLVNAEYSASCIHYFRFACAFDDVDARVASCANAIIPFAPRRARRSGTDYSLACILVLWELRGARFTTVIVISRDALRLMVVRGYSCTG